MQKPKMSKKERKESENFVRMSRLLLGGASVILRAHFCQAYEDAYGTPFVESLGVSFWNSLPQQTRFVLNDRRKHPPHVSAAQAKVRSGRVDTWDNTILRAVLCYGQCSTAFHSTLQGASPHAVMAPITSSRNELFAHAASMLLTDADFGAQINILQPLLLDLFQRLGPAYLQQLPFSNFHDFFSSVLKGLPRICRIVCCARQVPCLFQGPRSVSKAQMNSWKA